MIIFIVSLSKVFHNFLPFKATHSLSAKVVSISFFSNFVQVEAQLLRVISQGPSNMGTQQVYF